jgi:hypothetical protein
MISQTKKNTMTEAEWLACTDPEAMLEFLLSQATNRQLRLFVCACARQVGHQLVNEGSKEAVIVAEEFADGEATLEELTSAYQLAKNISIRSDLQTDIGQGSWSEKPAARTAAASAGEDPVSAASEAAHFGRITAETLTRDIASGRANAGKSQCCLLREILGNVFRPLPTRSFPTHVLVLSQACYDGFPDVQLEYGVLADALDELDESEAAAHCRE